MTETKSCQNCKRDFQIEPQDFAFYKKISVPPPTFCPQCRLQRRLTFLVGIRLYRRACDLCKKLSVSMYPPEAECVAYCASCWWSDKWSPLDYGKEYDFSRPFFQQLKEQWRSVPLLGLSIDPTNVGQSPYNNHCGPLKNSYLMFYSSETEECAYGTYVINAKSILDSSYVIQSEDCYDVMHSYKNNRCVGTRSQVTESFECYFLRDSRNCQNCFASANLRNAKYQIFNKQYSKEGYFKEIAQWDLGSYKSYKDIERRAHEHWKTLPPKPQYDEMAHDCVGINNVFESKNARDCFEAVHLEDCRWTSMIGQGPVKDCYDISNWGNNLSLCYESAEVGENASALKFCNESGINIKDIEYSKLSTGGSHHFGCISVRKTEYCILNKQYTKEEYAALIPKIKAHMSEMPYYDAVGRKYTYGEFFPIELSPYPYNATFAHSFFPLTKEDVLNQGYKWEDEDKKENTATIAAADLPDHIKDTPDSILNETVGCGECRRGFKIVPMELEFLRTRNFPLPRQCPFCRINEKLNIWVKNMRMLLRTCSKCQAVFETRYAEDETPYILCKSCYQKEIV